MLDGYHESNLQKCSYDELGSPFATTYKSAICNRYYPLRLDNQLYIEVVFNQIAPDYLEGLLLVMPGEQIEQECVFDISKVAALLHRAADMDHKPTIKETKFLLPKPALYVQFDHVI